MTRPFFDFINAGYDVDVASPRGGKVVFDGHSNPENPKGAYRFCASCNIWKMDGKHAAYFQYQRCRL